MKKFLVAGATGYLGSFLVKKLKKQGYYVRALVRNTQKSKHLSEYVDEFFEAEVTKPQSLKMICEGVDCVISSLGITRQKDGLTYMDVDYQGNKNLLEEAVKSKVKKFIYVSVINAEKIQNLKIIQAKLKFENELKSSGLNYTIIRPTGFFSDMKEFLDMAQKGKVSLFGNGESRMNPIHGKDLAEFCVNSLGKNETLLEVGGPETHTYKEIAEMAFRVLDKKDKISSLPLWMIKVILPLMRLFTSSKTYGPIEFMMTVMTMDGIGRKYGKERLEEFFRYVVHQQNYTN